ncbi:glycosyltransferase family 87 protein [Actinacidiphila rubida]|uniref:glycosyltransferase family 87 protein n=1 Tax=Actinacidiphila rubida TaxID=310780 RepID=UPI001FE71B1B|nr:glycosyltransferase family 87 protein [Actinacidiphila rubida]
MPGAPMNGAGGGDGRGVAGRGSGAGAGRGRDRVLGLGPGLGRELVRGPQRGRRPGGQRDAGEERQGPGVDAPGAWLRARASLPAQGAALLLLVLTVTEIASSAANGLDNRVLVTAGRALLDGRSPYADKRLLYLPSSVPLAVPEAELGARVLQVLVPVVTALAILAGWRAALRIFDVGLRSRLGVAVAGGLAYFAPFRSEVGLGNWTVASVLALPVALGLAARNRWTAAAAVIGAAIACKPMLLPVALLFVFARRWRALAVLAGIPLAASALAALLIPRPGLLVTKTLPFLLHGQDAFARPYDASLGTVLPRAGVPHLPAVLIAAALAAAGVAAAWIRWRRGGDGRLRLVETASMLMLATFVLSRPAFLHYVLVVLPVLLASLPLRGAVPRSPWFWIVLLPQNGALLVPALESLQRRAFRDAVMLTGLCLVLTAHCLRRPAPAPPDAAGCPAARAAHPLPTGPPGAAGPAGPGAPAGRSH